MPFLVALFFAVFPLAGCAVLHVLPSPEYTGPAPLPAEIRARFTFPHVVVSSAVEPTAEPGRMAGRVDAVNPETGEHARATFEYFRAVENGPRPLVVVSPIMGGSYPVARLLCRWFAADGFHALFVHRPVGLLDMNGGKVQVERSLRGMVLDTRLVLDVMLRRPEIDARRVGAMGVSLGAIKNSVLAAVEPRIRAHVLALGGGNLAEVVRRSDDKGVRRYRRRWSARTGEDENGLARAIKANLQSDPLVMAPYVDARRVLMFLAKQDVTVPFENGLALCFAMGGPETYIVSAGHYSAILYLPWVYARAREFLERGLGDVEFEG